MALYNLIDKEIPWASPLPDGWDVKPLYSFCELRQGKAHEPFVDENGVYVCVNSRFISTEGKKVKYCTEKLTEARLNDILMVMSDLPNGKALAKAFFVEKNPELYAVNQRVCAITVSGANPKFLYYQMSRSPYFLQFDDGVNQTHLSNYAYQRYPALLPDLETQNAIVILLDREIARIDSLISEKNNFVNLLKEKRQALISHVVTKGLDPDVETKDSGVEWIGEIPKHWSVKPYKYACKIYRGKFSHRPRNDPAFYDGQHPFIQTGDVSRADGFITSYKQTLNDMGASVSKKFPSGTLVMTIAANIGDTAILGFDAYAPDSIVGFKPEKDTDLNYLRYGFDSSIQELERTSIQNTQSNLNVDRIGSVKFVFPPLLEQIEIVKHIELKTKKLDAIISEVTESIELLKEHRTALINAAVTGKIDLRDKEVA